MLGVLRLAHNESYTTEELAKLLKVSKLTIYDLIKKGDLVAYRVGRQMRIDASELASYKKRSQEGGTHNEQTRPQETVKQNNQMVVISGQDHSLDLFARFLEQSIPEVQPLRSQMGSLDSLISLYEGKSDIVSTHLYDGDSETYNIPYIRKLLVSKSFVVIHFIEREAGLFVQKGNPKNIQSWQDLSRSDIKIVNREPGAGARVLLDEMLRKHGIDKLKLKGYETEETNHASVASQVMSERADVGVGIRQAANSINVDFIPLITESYDLVMLKESSNTELISQVQNLLQEPHFQEELNALGYNIKGIGTVLYEQ